MASGTAETSLTEERRPVEAASREEDASRDSSPAPPPRRPDRKFQWVWLFLSSGTIVLSMLMQIRNSQQVTVPFTEIPLPELCSFRRMTGMDCAGCGMTRCFISLGHGDLAGAWSYSPAGILLYGIVLFQIPFRAWQLWRIRRGLPELYLAHYGYSGMVLFAVLMVAQWGIKLAASYF